MLWLLAPGLELHTPDGLRRARMGDGRQRTRIRSSIAGSFMRHSRQLRATTCRGNERLSTVLNELNHLIKC